MALSHTTDRPTTSSLATAASSIIYLGMDVHKESTIAVLPEHATAPTRLGRLPNDFPKVNRWPNAFS
jgi:hypothetical protein